jgi:pyruvate formate lyase activating enzyme
MENDKHNKYKFFNSPKGDLGGLHSYETFGTVDGPGIRFVIFAQGCPLRCQYCHNPDTWDTENAKIIVTPEELLHEALKYKTYFQKHGGITISGGEPLFQAEFVTEFFKLCKKENIHTAIDTSGYFLNNQVKEVLGYTDLVLLDLKTINPTLHQTLTGVKADNSFKFLDYLQKTNKPTWIRHVVVPTITDNEKDLDALARYLKNYSVVERVEILPYHTFGQFKYQELNKKYPLEGIPELSKEKLEEAKTIFRNKGLVVD